MLKFSVFMPVLTHFKPKILRFSAKLANFAPKSTFFNPNIFFKFFNAFLTVSTSFGTIQKALRFFSTLWMCFDQIFPLCHAPKNSPIKRVLSVEGKDLVCVITADNKKQIRTGAASFFEVAILALRTLEKFDVQMDESKNQEIYLIIQKL